MKKKQNKNLSIINQKKKKKIQNTFLGIQRKTETL